MRLDNDRQDIFISDEKTVDQTRYSMIVEEYREKIEDPSDDAADEDSEDALSKVLSKLPLILSLILFAIAAIMFAEGRIIPALLICFIGFPTANILSLFFKKGGRDNIRNTAVTTFFCFITAIPLFFAKRMGTVAAILTAASVMIALTGIALIASFIRPKVIKRQKYRTAVPANCTGYARTVVKSPQSSKGQNIFFLKTSPVFEYRYEDSDYVSVYDPMPDGGNADIDMGPLTINIDPDQPEDVWRSEGTASLAKLIVGLSLLVTAAIPVIAAFVLGFVK